MKYNILYTVSLNRYILCFKTFKLFSKSFCSACPETINTTISSKNVSIGGFG